jgi:uncharacterized protein YndB with AHSA1/START domain
MRIALAVLGLLVALIAGVFITGMLLPKEHTARSSATIRATPDSVWSTLTAVEAFPSWRDDVTRVEVVDSAVGGKRWREIGKDDAILFEQVAAERPRRLVTRIADPNLPFGGSWTYDIAQEGGATRVTITEDGVVHNPLFRFMSRFVFGHYATQEAFLRALGRKFGQETAPVRG